MMNALRARTGRACAALLTVACVMLLQPQAQEEWR